MRISKKFPGIGKQMYTNNKSEFEDDELSKLNEEISNLQRKYYETLKDDYLLINYMNENKIKGIFYSQYYFNYEFYVYYLYY